jgi:hypothetical protein
MALLVGTCEVDITPPVGTPLCGSLSPRPSVGTEDPLLAKAIVLESEGTRLAYVLLDIAVLERADGDEAVRLASDRTGIPADHIVWACSHTHTGPYTCFEEEMGCKVIDRTWLKALPGKFAEAVAGADAAKTPARAFRARGYQAGLSHTRRFRYKDGRQINTWLLNRGEDEIQCIASASPTDPEVGVLAFEDERGRMLALMFHFTLHANANFGPCFSGDYPAVVAARMRERFGTRVSSLYVPGACGDQNTIGGRYRAVGDALSECIFGALTRRKPLKEPVRLGAMKRDVVVPFQDIHRDQEERIRASQWSAQDQDFFRRSQAIMRRDGKTQATTVVQAWHIGEVGFASLPGEPFVQWGIQLKERSTFPWTYMVELGGDYIGYLITQDAWEGGGYESLVSCVSKATPAGVQKMVDAGLDMLQQLHTRAATP